MKRTANLSVDIDMLFEAKSPDTNIPQTLKTAIQSSNTWVNKHGLPLAKYQQFPL